MIKCNSKKIFKFLTIFSTFGGLFAITPIISCSKNNSIKSNNKLNAQEDTDGGYRIQRYNFAAGLIGSSDDEAIEPQDDTINRRWGNDKGLWNSQSFMFSYANEWFKNEKYFPGSGGADGAQPSKDDPDAIGIPVVINRADGVVTDGLDFSARMNVTDVTKAHPGVFLDLDGDLADGSREIDGNYNPECKIKGVDKGLYYYVYAIGDKKNIEKTPADAGFSDACFNCITGKITLPETCCVIGNYAFDHAKGNDNHSTLTITKNINWIGHNAFEGCKFWDINFTNDNLNEINKIVFSGTDTETVDAENLWRPELTNDEGGRRGYAWFPYSSQTIQEVEDGVTYNVTRAMKAYHDRPNFGFKYSEMKNGQKVEAPILDKNSINTIVSTKQLEHYDTIKASMGKIDPNNTNNVVTFSCYNPNVLFSIDGNEWSNKITSSGKTEYEIKVKSIAPVSNVEIIASVYDNHQAELKSICKYGSRDSMVGDFKWENNDPISITINPNENSQLNLRIMETSSMGGDLYIPGAYIKLVGDNVPSWIQCCDETTSVSGLAGFEQLSMSYEWSEDYVGTYEFKIKATSKGDLWHMPGEIAKKGEIYKDVKITVNSNKPKPWYDNWIWWFVAGVIFVTLMCITTISIVVTKCNKNKC